MIKKTVNKYWLTFQLMLIGGFLVCFSSCKKDDPQPEYGVPISNYQISMKKHSAVIEKDANNDKTQHTIKHG